MKRPFVSKRPIGPFAQGLLEHSTQCNMAISVKLEDGHVAEDVDDIYRSTNVDEEDIPETRQDVIDDVEERIRDQIGGIKNIEVKPFEGITTVVLNESKLSAKDIEDELGEMLRNIRVTVSVWMANQPNARIEEAEVGCV